MLTQPREEGGGSPLYGIPVKFWEFTRAIGNKLLFSSHYGAEVPFSQQGLITLERRAKQSEVTRYLTASLRSRRSGLLFRLSYIDFFFSFSLSSIF